MEFNWVLTSPDVIFLPMDVKNTWGSLPGSNDRTWRTKILRLLNKCSCRHNFAYPWVVTVLWFFTPITCKILPSIFSILLDSNSSTSKLLETPERWLFWISISTKKVISNLTIKRWSQSWRFGGRKCSQKLYRVAFYLTRLPDSNLFWSNDGIQFFFFPNVLLQLYLLI